MADITWAIVADFDKDGVFETDLKAAFLEAGISGVINIDRSVALDGTPQLAKVSMTLANRDGTFTRRNTASSLYGLLESDVPFYIKATHSAVDYFLFTGYIDDYEWTYGNGPPTCAVSCVSALTKLQRARQINVTVDERTSDEALEAIAIAAGLSGGDYSFAAGQQTFPVHYVRNQDALSAMLDVTISEMGGALYENALGQVVGLARNSRLGTTVDDTWGDGTTLKPTTIKLKLKGTELVSKVTIQANIFGAGSDANDLLWFFSRDAITGDSILLAPGETKTFDIDYAGPVVAPQAMEAGTDYTANTAIDGTGTDMTASLSVTATDLGAGVHLVLKNTHASTSIYVTKMQQRGQQWEFVPDRPRIEYSKSIPGQTIEQSQAIELPFADDTQATVDYAPSLTHIYRQPYEIVDLTFEALLDAGKVSQLSRELWDLVRYTDTAVGVNYNTGDAGAYFDEWLRIIGIQHAIPVGEEASFDFETTFTCVPSYLFPDLDHMVWDTFNRDDATGDLGTTSSGDTWADDTGFNIASLAARPNSTGTQLPNIDLGVADCKLEVSLSNMSADADEEVGVIYRYADASNYWRAVWNDTGDLIQLKKRVAGVTTTVATFAVTAADTGELRVLVQGNRHRVWWGRKCVIDSTDAALNTNTKVGLFSNSTTVVDFNDFLAEGL